MSIARFEILGVLAFIAKLFVNFNVVFSNLYVKYFKLSNGLIIFFFIILFFVVVFNVVFLIVKF